MRSETQDLNALDQGEADEDQDSDEEGDQF